MSQANESYTIVVAVDFSETSNLALDRALELYSEKGAASLHAVHVLSLRPPAMAEAVPAIMGQDVSLFRQSAERLKAYVEERAVAFSKVHPGRALASPTHRIVTHQRVVAPAEEIAQLAADLEADLVVVGSHGRRGVSRLISGSVAEAVVRLAPCPVLVVRPKALPPAVPAIEPPCPRCLAARKASGGQETWCEQHREHHGQRHTYHQSDRAGAQTNMPLVIR